MFAKLCLIILLASSCTTLQNPDVSLLRSWNEDLQNKEPAVPYAKIYSREKKKLIFIGSDHGRDLNSPTHLLIKKTIESLKPQLVIIEGLETELGFDVSFVLERIRTNPPKMNEGSYAAKIANENKIPFIGGEFSDKEIKVTFSKDSDFTLRDLLAFRLIQGIATFNHEQPDWTLTRAMDEVYSYVDPKNQLTKDEIINEQELLNWFQESSGKKFNYKELNTNDISPQCQSTATKIQKINCKINRLRNTHLTNLISKSFTKYDSVLIVYGAGHQVQLDLVLRSFLPEFKYL